MLTSKQWKEYADEAAYALLTSKDYFICTVFMILQVMKKQPLSGVFLSLTYFKLF